jgi:hypothetical protein
LLGLDEFYLAIAYAAERECDLRLQDSSLHQLMSQKHGGLHVIEGETSGRYYGIRGLSDAQSVGIGVRQGIDDEKVKGGGEFWRACATLPKRSTGMTGLISFCRRRPCQ